MGESDVQMVTFEDEATQMDTLDMPSNGSSDEDDEG